MLVLTQDNRNAHVQDPTRDSPDAEFLIYRLHIIQEHRRLHEERPPTAEERLEDAQKSQAAWVAYKTKLYCEVLRKSLADDARNTDEAEQREPKAKDDTSMILKETSSKDIFAHKRDIIPAQNAVPYTKFGRIQDKRTLKINILIAKLEKLQVETNKMLAEMKKTEKGTKPLEQMWYIKVMCLFVGLVALAMYRV